MSSAASRAATSRPTRPPAPSGAARGGDGVKRGLSRVPTWLWALAFYMALALVTIGWFALGHLGSICACDGGADPAIFMWGLQWFPHAVVHGLNPLMTNYQWAPTGVNLAKSPQMASAAIVMAPVTALFGPIVSHNVVSIASPALAAFTAYLLCRHLVKRELPAVVGGLLFGFSSYEFSQLLGHLPLVAIFLIPVMVLLAVRRVERETSRRSYLIWMAVVIVVQLGLSTEWLALCVMLGMFLLVVARFIAVEPQRARMNGLIAETILAGLIAMLVSSPFLYYAAFSGGFQPGFPMLSDVQGLDLANLVSPTVTTWLGHSLFLPLSTKFQQGDPSETDGYLTIALAAAFLIWFFSEGRRTVLGKLLGVTVLVSIVMALGSHLHVGGSQSIPLPYYLVKDLPVFNLIVPSRIVLFAELAIAIGVSAWLAKPGGRVAARWALVGVGIVMLIPNIEARLYGGALRNPRFFNTALYRHYLTRNETVLVLPFAHNDLSTLWQAETGFYFYMPEGYVLGTIPNEFIPQPAVLGLFNNEPIPASTVAVFMKLHHVRHVVIDAAQAGIWPKRMSELGLRAQRVGGVLLYSVPQRMR